MHIYKLESGKIVDFNKAQKWFSGKTSYGYSEILCRSSKGSYYVIEVNGKKRTPRELTEEQALQWMVENNKINQRFLPEELQILLNETIE